MGYEGRWIAPSTGSAPQSVQTAADALATCGARTFLALESPDFGVGRYASDAAAATALVTAAAATLVLAPGSSRLARALPGVAVRTAGRIDTHLVALGATGDTPHVQRWYYRQRLLVTLTRRHRAWYMLLESGVFPAWRGETGRAALQRLQTPRVTWERTRVEGCESTASGAQTIRTDAELLLAAGAGWTKKQADGHVHDKEAERLILEFLDVTQASLGGSKSVVDQTSETQTLLRRAKGYPAPVGTVMTACTSRPGVAIVRSLTTIGTRFLRVLTTPEPCGIRICLI